MNEKPSRFDNKSINLSSDEAVVAAVPKEAFKAMFYLFAGKPDSKVKILNRRVIVKAEDIQDLNYKITDKLKLHLIDQSVSSAVIKFDKEKTIEFGTWAELQSYDFKLPYVTQEIFLKWDFLIKLPAYAAAQRHTLTVRLSTKPNPKDVLQAILSQDSDDASELETKLGLCITRVDFISHRLADELIDVVVEWNNSLLQPDSACGWFCKLEKWDKWIARVIHYSIPILTSILALVLLGFVMPKNGGPITSSSMIYSFRWLLISILCLYVMINLSEHLANESFSAINEYGMFAPFLITRGDENQVRKIEKRNKKKIIGFFVNSGIALFLNIVAGLATCFLLPKT
jgi:hypothetical protein